MRMRRICVNVRAPLESPVHALRSRVLTLAKSGRRFPGRLVVKKKNNVWPLLGLVVCAAPAFAQSDVEPQAVGKGAESETQTLETVTVVGEAPNDYAANGATVGSRMELPLRDVPQSISVISEEIIEDLAPRQLDEIADYIAGVDREAVQGNPYAISFYFRGFNTAGTASSYNGFREYGFNTPQSAVNIERIEFLKGPASVLYGSSRALSGLVNIVSKQPLAVQRNRVELSAGSFDHLAASLDSTGPLNDDKSLRYRLTASADKDGNFVDETRQQSLFVSPVLSWDLSPSTTLDLELLAQDVDRPGREPYFSRDPDFFRIPVTTQLGDPTVPLGDGGKLTRKLGRLDLRHRFGNGLTLRQGLFAHNVASDDSTIQPTGYDPVTRLLSRRVRAVDEYQRERTSQTDLFGTARTGSLEHQWLVGFEVGESKTGYLFRVAPYSAIDIFNPQRPGTVGGELTVPFPGVDSGNETRGIYFQDLVSIGTSFKVSLGGRYDWIETFSEERVDDSEETRQDDEDFSPRLGLIWQPNARSSYFVAWSRSFVPNTGTPEGGGTFDPQRGEQYEIGTHYELFQSAALTASVFEYTRENVLTVDPDNTDFSIPVGEQRSRGAEFELVGTVLRGWNIIASYGYLDAEVTRDNRLPDGDRLVGVPRHTIGLFNKVSLAALGFAQWSVTAGVAHATDRESGLPNDPAAQTLSDGSTRDLSARDVRLPSYTQVDAGLIYETPTLTLRLNGRNLTDDEIYDGYISTFQPRAPRSMEVSIGLNF